MVGPGGFGGDPQIPLFTRDVDLREHNEIILHPVSDVHIGADAHCTGLFEAKLDHIAGQPENHRIILHGDLEDVAIVSSVGFKHGARTPQWELDQIRQMLKHRKLEPRVDLLIPGNHERRAFRAAGLDLTAQLASLLGRPETYRPGTTVLLYRIGTFKKTHAITAEIFVHHGFGGGRKTGGKIQKNLDLKLIKPDCDVYVSGHTHAHACVIEIVVTGWPPRIRRQYFCSTGTYLGSAEAYSMDFAFPPVAIGAPIIHLGWETAGRGTRQLLVRVEQT